LLIIIGCGGVVNTNYTYFSSNGGGEDVETCRVELCRLHSSICQMRRALYFSVTLLYIKGTLLPDIGFRVRYTYKRK
jgi:hypothetical protein